MWAGNAARRVAVIHHEGDSLTVELGWYRGTKSHFVPKFLRMEWLFSLGGIQMLDIKKIRQNPDFYKQKLATRGIQAEEIDEVLALDQKRRDLLQQKETMKRQRNAASK